MADPTKHLHIHGGTLIKDIKNLFSVIKTRRTVTFAYFFMFVFVAFTVFLAFSPSQNSSSPWFINMFSDGTKSSNFTTKTTSAESFGSQFSSIVSHFFPNSSQKPFFDSQQLLSPNSSVVNNCTEKGNVLKCNETGAVVSSNGSLSTQKGSQENSFPESLSKVDPKEKNLISSGNSTAESPRNESLSAQKGSQENSFPESLSKVDPKEKNLVSSGNSTAESPRNESFSAQKSSQENGSPEFLSAVNNGSSVVKNETLSALGNQTRNQNASFPKETVFQEDVVSKKHEMDDWIKSLMNCDLYDGKWVMDNSYPLYKPGSCSFIDEQFNCILNGRPDADYQKFKWKPKGCTLPRMNGSHLLELIRGKRLVFVGDSLNRNMWESLVCILKNSVKDPKKVYEAHGKVNFRGEAMYSFVFKDYKCTVEFFVAPFLVREWEMPDKNGSKKETLRLDLVGRSSYMYKDADFIVFNTGHWWTHEKTSKGLDYYQVGNHVYGELNVLEAFRKALTTWGRWVDAYVNPEKSIAFFRGYSVSHFSGGQWNSGGACDSETEPIKNDTYIKPYPPKMMVLESVLKRMKTHVTYLNITRITDYRKDGHPSIYRKLKVPDAEKREPLKYQDCSHWCLPGVPDAWNELLYAELLVRLYQKQNSRRS